MDDKHFPSFRKSGWYKQWLRSKTAGFYKTVEIERKCLETAYCIWAQAYKQHKADRRGGDRGLILPG